MTVFHYKINVFCFDVIILLRAVPSIEECARKTVKTTIWAVLVLFCHLACSRLSQYISCKYNFPIPFCYSHPRGNTYLPNFAILLQNVRFIAVAYDCCIDTNNFRIFSLHPIKGKTDLNRMQI